MKKYIMIIKEEYVRDAQVCVNYKKDIWRDLFPKVLLGLFEAEDEINAINMASLSTGYPVDIIEATLVYNTSSDNKKEQVIPTGQTNIYDYLKE